MTLGPVFSRLLADRRASFNARLASARVRNPGFDIASFSSFLEAQADPLIDVVLAKHDDAGTALADAIFEMAVTLTEHRWVGSGARSPLVNSLWHDVAPVFCDAIAANPKEVLGALSNAAITLSAEPSVRMEQWLDLLKSVGAHMSTAHDVRHLAAVCAWRAGGAHMRGAALEAAAKLPTVSACIVLGDKRDAGAKADWSQLASIYARHRWWTPDGVPISQGHHIGAFTGLGGVFAQPPELAISHDHILVHSAERYFTLYADGFGASLRPHRRADTTPVFRPDSSSLRRLKGAHIQADDRQVALALPTENLSIVETSDSIALSSPLSHSIHIVPKTLPGTLS